MVGRQLNTSMLVGTVRLVVLGWWVADVNYYACVYLRIWLVQFIIITDFKINGSARKNKIPWYFALWAV